MKPCTVFLLLDVLSAASFWTKAIESWRDGIRFLAGFIVIPFMAVSYYKGSWEFRKISVDITLLVGILLFFGIVVDAIHSMLSEVVYISGILALIEDGGEMVAVSIILWCFYFLFMHPNRKELFLHEVFVSS